MKHHSTLPCARKSAAACPAAAIHTAAIHTAAFAVAALPAAVPAAGKDRALCAES